MTTTTDHLDNVGADALGWSREVFGNTRDGFSARVPEFQGCVASGRTAEEALRRLDSVVAERVEIARAEGSPLPEPRRVPDEFSGRFSIRVPSSLHRQLSERAAREGSSLNQMVGVLLAQALAGSAPQGDASFPRRSEDISEEWAVQALSTTEDGASSLKGIATYLRNRGDISLACLIYGKAADVVARTDSAIAGSREYGVTAALARKHRRLRLAEGLLRESVRLDPTNLRSASALGQILHRHGQYLEAIGWLERAQSVDNYAKTFLGWSLIMNGIDLEDPSQVEDGRGHLVDALTKWAYQNADDRDRRSWLRQVGRLFALGGKFEPEAQHLVEFANSNASWARISNAELSAVTREGAEEQDSDGDFAARGRRP